MRKTQMALTRLLSLLLVLAMLLGAMPLGVLAAEEPAVPDSEAQSGMSVTDVTAELTEEEMLQLFRENMDTELVQEADLPDLDEEVRVIVELDVDSLLDLRQEQNMETVAMGEFLETAAAQSLLLEIQETQDSVMAQMSAAGIAGELTYAYSTVTSGFAAKMTYGEMLQVAEMEGVRKVTLSEMYYPDVVGEAALGQALTGAEVADYANSTAYQGEGMLIGILDTGLDYTHEAFLNEPEVQKLTLDGLNKIAKYDFTYDENGEITNVTAYSFAALWYAQANSKTEFVLLTAEDLYVNGKVPFAFDYADYDHEVMPTATSVERYGNDHGTHVAGIAAGKAVDEDGNVTFAGQAPEAQLAIFKVFPDGSSGASTDTLLAALNDAILLGVDVINMSLGSPAGFSADTSDTVNTYYDAVKAYGILLNCSGGNTYSSSMGGAQSDFAATSDPDTGVSSSASSYDAALSVASINMSETTTFTVGETKVAYNDVSGYDFAALLLGGQESADFEYVMVPGTGTPEDYAGLDVTGKLAVVMRGGLSFNDKQLNAAAAGAVGCVIYNNRSGYLLNMAVDNYTIPTVSISDTDGKLLAEQENKTLRVSTGAGMVEMSVFSSWGPLPSLELKPEITAPGGDVYSSLPFGKYGAMSGTSMASPYVAGSSAAVLQYVNKLFPGATLAEKRALVNQLMMSTADIVYDGAGVPYSPRKQGSGLVDVEAAVSTPAYIYVKNSDKTKLELGDDDNRTGVYDLEFQVKNVSGKSVSYAIEALVQTESVSADGQFILQAGYALNADTQIRVSGGTLAGNVLTVAPGTEATVLVTIVLDAASKAYMDANFDNGIYVEGFVELTNAEDPSLSIPYLAFYGDWSEAPIFEDADYFNGEDVKMYATTVGGVYGLMYVFPLGTYVLTTPEGYEAPAPSADLMSLNLGSGNGMSNLYYLMAGQLRGAATTSVEIRDADTGELIHTMSGANSRKAYYNTSTGAVRPGYVGDIWPQLMSYSVSIPSGTRLSYSLTATVDAEGAQKNDKNDYYFEFTADSEMPWVVNRNDLKFYYGEDGRVYLDVVMADNFALAGATLYSAYWTYDNYGSKTMKPYANYYEGIMPAVTEEGTAPGAYEEYLYTFDVTDFYKELTDGVFYILAYDYAMNECCLKVVLDEIPVTGLSLDTTEATLPIRGYVQLNATVTPDNATNQALVWTSSDTAVAEVRNGLVKAVGTGTATITATAKAYTDITATCTITVTEEMGPEVPMEEFVLNRSYLTINAGDSNATTKLSAYTPYTATNFDLTWSSSDETVATVDADGVITGVSAGTATITAKAVLGDASASVEVTVKEASGDGTGSFAISGDVLVSYSGTEETVTVPDGIRVIADNAFKSNTSIKHVVLPATVEEIGYRAFYGCSNLESINLPETMTSLGEQSFYNCKKLTTLGLDDKGLIPKGLTVIPVGCFYNCNALEGALIVPEGVTTICKEAFYGLKAITSITLPETLVSWGDGYAQFSGCAAVTEINLPTSITTLPRNCFFNCTALTELPDLKNVTELGQACFQNCYGLLSVTVPAQITVMGNNVFYGCKALTTAHIEGDPTMGESIFEKCVALTTVTGNFTTIPVEMFRDCDGMVSFTVPDGVTSIGKYAFYGCDLLESVIVPATYNAPSLTVGEEPFKTCKLCTGFTVAEGCTALKYVDGILYSGDGKTLIALPVDFAETTFAVAEGVETIAPFAFKGKTKLKTVTFPESLKTIGENAFQGCTALTAIDLPDGVTTVGAYAFSECSAVTTLDLGKSLTSVEPYAFNKLTKVTAIVLPETVQYVAEYAFYNCNVATTITMPEGMTSIGKYAFYGCKKAEAIIVPSTVTEMGDYAFYNCTVAKTINCGSITEIPSRAFYGCNAAASITMSDTVTSVGDYAFNGCRAVTHIDWPSALETVGRQAFYGCYALDDLDLSGTKIRTIGNSAFYQPYVAETLVLPETVETIDAKAFAYLNYNKTAYVTEVRLPASVTYIAKDAFYYANRLQSITVDAANPVYTSADGILIVKETGELYIWPMANTTTEFTVPANMTTIPSKMFQNNASLKKVYIHSGVEYIGTYAFSGSKIEEFVFEPSAAGLQIDSYAFNNCDKLVQIELPYGTTALNSSVFSGCDALVSAYLPDTISYMNSGTFSNCKALTDVHLPAALAELPTLTFSGCSSLEEVTLPAGMSGCGIGRVSSAWSQCPSLKNVWVEEGSLYFKSVDGVLYDITGKVLWIYPMGRTDTSYTIPEGTVRVAGRSALGNTHLESITFPSTLTRIGDMAFYLCENLKDFYFNGMSAPVLETTTTLDGAYLNYACYWNFVDKWMTVDTETYKVIPNELGLNLYYPEGATGFDAYVWEIYFQSGSTNVMDASYFTVTNLTAEEAEGRTAALRWDAAKRAVATDIVYTVERADATHVVTDTQDTWIYGDFVVLAEGLTATEFTDETALHFGMGYAYRVSAYDRSGNTGPAALVTLTIAADESNADEMAALAVIQAIEALNPVENLTLEDEETVKAVQAMYDALTDAQKALVPNLPTLEAAFAWIDGLYAAAVEALIEALPEPALVTTGDADQIAAARAAYEALTEAQKALVPNLSKLTDCEAALAEAISVEAVEQLIAALPTAGAVTLEDAEAIAAARAAYEALTETEKAKVSPSALEKLAACEAALSWLQEIAAVEALIEALPAVDMITTGDAEAIAAARAAYDALTEEQKALVSNLDKLLACEAALASAEAVEAVEALIDALPAPITVDAAEAIAEARAAYEALTPEEQAEVGNYGDLVAAEAALEVIKSIVFTDVKESDWFYADVYRAVGLGLVSGMGNNEFQPNTKLTRAMLVTLLYRLEGTPEVSGDCVFTDVAADAWYADAVVWAAANGITSGVTETTFAPNADVTREQAATFLYRYAKSKGYDVSAAADLSSYPDAALVSGYAQEAMAWAVANGLINGVAAGSQVRLEPRSGATRAQAATILVRFYDKFVAE
ncbi:MAG: leucine-rich repeat protein [Oscillospiraceae bacterium]|nr:leucine-rich repeat protein [Oscillospiraceae bacterium]